MSVALCCIYVTIHVVVSFFELCVDVFVISEVHKVKTSQLRSSLDDLSVTAVIGHRHIKSSNFRFRGFYFVGELSIKNCYKTDLCLLWQDKLASTAAFRGLVAAAVQTAPMTAIIVYYCDISL